MHDSQILFFLPYEFEHREMSVSIWQLICQSFRLLLGIFLSVYWHANPSPVLSSGNIPGPLPKVGLASTVSPPTHIQSIWKQTMTSEADFIVYSFISVDIKFVH